LQLPLRNFDQHLVAGVASSVELTPNFGLGGRIGIAGKQTTVTLNNFLFPASLTDACEACHQEGQHHAEFFQKIAEERATYQRMLNPTAQ
jgi:hypothetical protein